jgi:putative aldouronate transport system permease protein
LTISRTKNRIRNARSDNVFVFIVYLLAILVLLVVLLPLLYVVSSSFSSPEAIIKNKVRLFPVNFTLSAYKSVFNNMDILIGYRNTIFYAVVGTTINILMTIALAYPLSKRDFRGRGILSVMCTITMFFSGGMIPTFLIIKNLGLYNSVWALIIPKSISVWNMFLLRNYFQNSIPSELIESSRVDGASEWRIMWQVVLPLSKSIIAVLTIFYVVGHWNAYFDAILYLEDRAKYPLQVILREILMQGQGAFDSGSGISSVDQLMAYESMKYAVIIVASAPVLALYPFLQRYFVKGIMVGSIKG